ncbi:MAG: pyridoxal-phosphate dependent enzyme [Ferruginibacter sp.]
MLFDISKANIEELHDELFLEKQVKLYILRLDKIHPLLSGNKIFKLQYFLEDALASDHKTVLTFGGAYSNHLAATAYACRILQLKSIGIVRGEKPAALSPTLQQCIADGMHVKFISRQEYDKKESLVFIEALKAEFGAFTAVPEGGYNNLGVKGAALIYDMVKTGDYTHICMAAGTATTLAGILVAAKPEQTVVAIPVLKGFTGIEENVKFLTGKRGKFNNLEILDAYHFGGYAKKNEVLIDFINHCWQQYQLPLDFVYTARMMFGVMDNIKKNNFKKGSKIICLHTGGLQGNKSLPLNILLF